MQSEYYFLISLVVVYWLESIILIDKQTIIFYKHSFGSWQFKFSKDLLDIGKFKLFFTNLIPLGSYFTGYLSPLAFSKDGILRTDGHARDLNKKSYFLFTEIENISCREKWLLINHRPFLKLNYSQNAKILAQEIRVLKNSSPQMRQEKIRENYEKLFPERKTTDIFAAFERNTLVLRILSVFLFMLIFVIVPGTIFLKAFYKSWFSLLQMLLVNIILILVYFYSAHKRLFPESNSERWKYIFMFAFSPLLAIQPSIPLSRDLFFDVHPLLPARLLLTKEEFVRFSSVLLRRIRYHNTRYYNSIEYKIYSSYREFQIDYIEAVLEDYRINKEQIWHAPVKESEEMTLYCPSCLTQYRRDIVQCSDCAIDLKNL